MPTTRFYLSSTDTAPQAMTPAFDGSWEQTTSAIRRRCTLYHGGSAFANTAIAEASATNPYDFLLAQFISDPLAAQTIAGNVQGVIRCLESAADADFRAQMVIRVLSETGATVRGTLLAHDTSALSNEFDAATLTNRKFPLNFAGGGTAISSLAVLDNDRIVFEVGVRSHNATATSKTATMVFGGASASDLAIDETSTDQFCPWIEFDSTIAFVPQVTTTARADGVITRAGMPGGPRPDGSGEYGGALGTIGPAGNTFTHTQARPDSASTSFAIVGGGGGGSTTYYKMRARDAGAAYVTWISTSADFAGVGYATGSPAPVGAMVGGSAVVAATWTA